MSRGSVNTFKQALYVWGLMHYALAMCVICVLNNLAMFIWLMGVGYMWVIVALPGVTIIDRILGIKPEHNKQNKI